VISTISSGGLPLRPALSASFPYPQAITSDGNGNIYFAASSAVYKVDSGGFLMRVARPIHVTVDVPDRSSPSRVPGAVTHGAAHLPTLQTISKRGRMGAKTGVAFPLTSLLEMPILFRRRHPCDLIEPQCSEV
jgi:hypothetical protein